MKIVCAIDGSHYSQWALDWLRRIRVSNDASLLLVHAVDMTQFKTFSTLDQKARSTLVKVLDFSLEAAAPLLESAELKAAQAWGACPGETPARSPSDGHRPFCETRTSRSLGDGVSWGDGVSADAPGQRLSKSAYSGFLSGSPYQEPARTLTRIVLGTDGSAESWAAVAWLEQLPETIRPFVTVASVIPPLPLEGSAFPQGALAVGDQVEGVLRREVQKLASRVAGALKKPDSPQKKWSWPDIRVLSWWNSLAVSGLISWLSGLAADATRKSISGGALPIRW
jgi:hypothetical protein